MYNINNLKVISRNISRYKSNIYNKNKINYMIKKKQNLIKQYEYIITSIFKYESSLVNNSYNSTIINRINQLKNSLSIVIYSLDKIEEEEKLIMRVFKISNYSIINCVNKYF
jgi:hypothetical protein